MQDLHTYLSKFTAALKKWDSRKMWQPGRRCGSLATDNIGN